MNSKVSLDKYKLSCELMGHSLDVRAVTEGNEACILSGSRDKTTRIWKKEGKQYVEELILCNHSNFVSCVYYYESEGWICTGSNDSTICIYKEGCIAPFIVLSGHGSTVCALTSGLEPKTLISGSWDQTARIWKISDDESNSFSSIILKGHQAAVWAVTCMKVTSSYATGSADKNIFVWDTKGNKIRSLEGHQDCVRGLISLDDGSLVSCGNDASIRHWNGKGECIRELHGHGNYIYAIAANKNLGKDIIVSGSEDSSIRMWSLESGNLGDSIVLPAQSVWSVCCLKNGDIVTGTSDGIVRVFTQNPERFASPEAIKAFNLAVQTRLLEINQELGGIKKTDLPGAESLLESGREGQTKMVRHPDGKVKCYQWENNQWNLIGDVMGASGGSQQSSGKTLYEGKEYDFVFSVDISDNAPPIKLPYNRGEDPWLAAQTFIHKNNLPQAYLEQVANFIIKNSSVPVIEQGNTSSGFADPFTGGSRYIPGAGQANTNASGNLDPFTGSSSYTTSTVNNTSESDLKHFPKSIYLTFDNCDLSKILEKLKEFNKKAKDGGIEVSENFLQEVTKLGEKNPDMNKIAVQALQHLLNWPKEILFPALDITRLALRNEQIFSMLQNNDNIIERLVLNLEGSPANQLMAVRGIVNTMYHSTGRHYILPHLEVIMEKVTNIKQGSPNLQIAIATLYFNLSVTQTQLADASKCKIIAEGILEFLKWAMDLEATYRCLQALGNLTCTPFGTAISAQIISMNYVMDRIREYSNKQISGFEKLTECSNALLAAF